MKDQSSKAKIKEFEPKYKDVTASDVKGCTGYEEISDEMAQGIADAIRVYTEVIYGCFGQSQMQKQETKVIALPLVENKKVA